MNLFVRKPLENLLSQVPDTEKGLKRTLGPVHLIALGIGAIIGAGLFVRTAAAASEAAGPAVVISYVIAAIGCAFAGLCYAEFASMIPIAGSAYTYAYVTMGEFIAWIIGWALILEYSLAGAIVGVAWGEYLNSLLGGAIPYQWIHSPWETSVNGVQGIINIPAIIILCIVTLILIRGMQVSAIFNAVVVFIKVFIVLIFIVLGWSFINEVNYIPFTIPSTELGHEEWNRNGIGGIFGGAAIVFFAFIGFDAVSTAAQEAKNPKRDMPIGILGSLLVCTILFVLFSHVLTGISNWQEFKIAGKEASVAYAIKTYMPGYGWLATLISVAILAGFTSVILVMLLGQSRIFYSMAKDGLLPKQFSELHPKFRTPYKSNFAILLVVAPFAGLVPAGIVGDLATFGTLFAFVMVCAGIWVMRVKNPDQVRPFKTPLVPLVPILGILICSGLIFSLGLSSKLLALSWMIIGVIIYFTYSRNNSLLLQKNQLKK